MSSWLRWLFRRGERNSLLLNMRPGDCIVAMIQFRQYLAIASREGELYLIDGDKLVTVKDAEILNCGREPLPR